MLMATTTCWYYFVGAAIGAAGAGENKRRFWMIAGIAVSLGVLAYYKYMLFFTVSLVDAFGIFGLHLDKPNWSVILPLGISFHTFQGVSYAVDVYRRTTPPAKDFLFFAVYSSFFPQLIAGPIERKGDVLPQLQTKHDFDWENFSGGIALILIGLLKKVVIADNMAAFADPIFADPTNYSSFELLVGAYAFSLQIFFDFSAYSQIAIGSARLFGINLSQNFNAPYLAANIVDFWRRWHMTLSRWLRDYLYIPLGGSRVSPARTYINLFATMVLGGLWHGANWTFVIWGAYHGALLSISHYLRERRAGQTELPIAPSMQVLSIIATFHLVTLGWIIFRAPNMETALAYVIGLIGNFGIPVSPKAWLAMEMIVAATVVWTFHHFFHRHIAHFVRTSPVYVRAACLIAFLIAVAVGADSGTGKFIYFEF
jgi:D-alanyl-lipoteichoic acid acyltransferase DltB (MBOAT superfamily)